jgi:hypothetical protein
LQARAGDRLAACRTAQRSVELFEQLKTRGELGGRDANKNLPLAVAARDRYCR